MRASDAARAGFAIGYAQATTVPLTTRARVACEAAQYAALEHPSADVVETTLILGKLEGTWAQIFDRRLKLIDGAVSKLRAAWTRQHVDIAGAVGKVRRAHSMPVETIVQPDPMIAAIMRSALESGIDESELADLLAQELPAAEAEGITGAIGLAADANGFASMDFDLVFQHALDALNRTESLTSRYWDQKAKAEVDSAIRGQVNVFTRKLSRLIEAGASRDDMEAELAGLFDSGDAMAYVTDVAMSTGLTQGALMLYRAEGVAQVSFVTAGDERVCPVCDAAEVGSPYDLGGPMPTPPLHGFCRCCVQAESGMTSPLVSQLISDQFDLG